MSEPTPEDSEHMRLPRNLICARCGQSIRRAEGFATSATPTRGRRYYHLSRERPCFQTLTEEES